MYHVYICGKGPSKQYKSHYMGGTSKQIHMWYISVYLTGTFTTYDFRVCLLGPLPHISLSRS